MDDYATYMWRMYHSTRDYQRTCVEDAIGAKVPVNAQYIRNMILAAHSIHDHIVHFYQLSAMDWVDITAALEADPEKAADMLKGVSTWSLNSANEFRNVQKKFKH